MHLMIVVPVTEQASLIHCRLTHCCDAIMDVESSFKGYITDVNWQNATNNNPNLDFVFLLYTK